MGTLSGFLFDRLLRGDDKGMCWACALIWLVMAIALLSSPPLALGAGLIALSLVGLELLARHDLARLRGER